MTKSSPKATQPTASARYPQIVAHLPGRPYDDLGTIRVVQDAMREAGVPRQELSNFCWEVDEAPEADLLTVCAQWVTLR